MLTEQTRDPVHRARYAFEPRGEDLYVECWLEPGGGLPEHLHPRQEAERDDRPARPQLTERRRGQPEASATGSSTNTWIGRCAARFS